MGCGSSKKSTPKLSRRSSSISSKSISNRNHSSQSDHEKNESCDDEMTRNRENNVSISDERENKQKIEQNGTHDITTVDHMEKEGEEGVPIHDTIERDDKEQENGNQEKNDKEYLTPETEKDSREIDVKDTDKNEQDENENKLSEDHKAEPAENEDMSENKDAELGEVEKNNVSEDQDGETGEIEQNQVSENQAAETGENEKCNVPENPPQENNEEDQVDKSREITNPSELVDREISALVETSYDNTFEIDDGYHDDYTPFDEEEKDTEIIDGYEKNPLGLMLKTVDCRTGQREEQEERPVVEPGELYTDKNFPLEIAIVQDTSGIEWKRPGEFLSDPVLFHEDATRFDIGQGSAGTCWFLSTVATMAGDMISEVIPKNAYNISNSENYDGVFHARFFHFGEWVDIYTDDYIPVLYGKVPWGAKSSTNENEIWVSLLEKAFARLHGSYNAVYGGQPGDAYLQLTGGIGERVSLDDHEESQDALYNRVKNALSTGSQVTCVVPDQYDNYKGLVGGHAYSLVGITKINNTKLLRIRNPWGKGEWTGPWSDESEEWQHIVSSGENVPKEDDGEFYVCLDDFMKYFSQTTICSLTPDFDCDGKSDPMNFILSIFGEWNDGKMGGFHDVLQNPRFSFTVSEEGMLEDGNIPLVVQMIQHTKRRKTGNVSMRCNLYKIIGQKLRSEGRLMAIEIQGKKNNIYTTELQATFRYRLKPGRYMAVPSTCDGGVKKEFLLRLYTPAPVTNIKEVPIDTNILSCENEESLTHNRITHSLSFERIFFGAFVSGVNAGGQVSNRDSYSGNPQYLISIPNTGGEVPVVVHIMQAQVEPQYPVGFRIFALDNGVNPPVNVDYLYDKYNDSPVDIEGEKSKFMISWDVDVRYLLPPGRYIGLVHLDQPDTEKSFAILFKSTTNIGIKGLQTGE